MSAGMHADREARARALLEAKGLPPRVRSIGMDGEIAAVSAPLSAMDALRAVAPGLRALGYRYVALDLADGTEPKEE